MSRAFGTFAGVNQVLFIGSMIRLEITDVDDDGVRFIAEGTYQGGPDDGGRFRSTHDLTVGKSVSFGPLVTVILLGVKSEVARFMVNAPTTADISVHKR